MQLSQENLLAGQTEFEISYPLLHRYVDENPTRVDAELRQTIGIGATAADIILFNVFRQALRAQFEEAGLDPKLADIAMMGSSSGGGIRIKRSLIPPISDGMLVEAAASVIAFAHNTFPELAAELGTATARHGAARAGIQVSQVGTSTASSPQRKVRKPTDASLLDADEDLLLRVLEAAIAVSAGGTFRYVDVLAPATSETLSFVRSLAPSAP